MTAPLLALALLAVAPDAEPIHLSPGAHSVLKIPGVNRVAIGDKDVADVHVSRPGELLLLGRRRGKTSMTLWTGDKITTRMLVVDDGASDDIARLVHDLVDPSLRVVSYEDRVVVDGMVDSLQDLRKLQRLLGDNPRVTLMVKLDPAALRVLAETITQALHRSGMFEAKATAVGSRVILEGNVTDEAEREKAQNIADAYYEGFVAQ